MNHASPMLDRLFSISLSGSFKMGLTNTLRLREAMAYPDRSYPIVHVTGTNGKGSVSTKIASALQAAGYRVGLFTSPHISTFRERARVNGEMISAEAVEDILAELFERAEEDDVPASFFEFTTLLAFEYFRRQEVDIAVIEVGLGGTLDATNVITPVLSVITSVSLDHTRILGSTVEEIARDKAGIIKWQVPVLIGPSVPRSVVRAVARKEEATLSIVDGTFSSYDEENSALARRALAILSEKFEIEDEAVERGLRVSPPCRYERRIIDGVEYIFDLAHNEAGIEKLFQRLSQDYPEEKFRIIIGMCRDKDHEKCFSMLSRCAAEFHLVQAEHERAATLEVLEKALVAKTNAPVISHHTNVEEAVRSIVRQETTYPTLICGSFYIMSDVRKALNIDEDCDPYDFHERLTVSNK